MSWVEVKYPASVRVCPNYSSKEVVYILVLENEKFFELKSKEYRNGIKRKETR